MPKQMPEWLENSAPVIVFILLSIAWGTTLNSVNNSAQWNWLLVNIPIGLLTFIGIFFSLVLKKEIQDKRKRILIKEWKKQLPNITSPLNIIKSESKKRLPNYDTMLSNSKELSDKLQDMTYFEEEMNLNKKLIWSVISFIVVIILVLVDTISNYSITFSNSQVYLRSVGYVFLWIGIWFSLLIVRLWYRIISHN